LRLARERVAQLEQVRQAATVEHEAATEALVHLGGGVWHRRERTAAAERLTLAEHGVQTTTRQAGQAAERAGRLRRAEQQRAGWLERHADLPQRQRLVTRELAWRGRADARALALDPPGWLVTELGPLPPAEQAGGRAAWTQAAVELDAWRRAYGLDGERPAKHGGREPARAVRERQPIDRVRSTPAMRPGQAATGDELAGAPVLPAGAAPWGRRNGRRWRDPGSAPFGRSGQLGDVPTATAEGLLGREPDRRQPGRRRDWQQVRAALERLAAHRDRTRDPNHQRRARHNDRHRNHQHPERTTAPHERSER
jgi:hypothetical protein